MAPFGAPMAPPWRAHGAPWRAHGAPWRAHGVPMAPWRAHGAPWRAHGASWRAHGAPWRAHGVPMAPMARPWRPLGRPWRPLACPWRPLTPEIVEIPSRDSGGPTPRGTFRLVGGSSNSDYTAARKEPLRGRMRPVGVGRIPGGVAKSSLCSYNNKGMFPGVPQLPHYPRGADSRGAGWWVG